MKKAGIMILAALLLVSVFSSSALAAGSGTAGQGQAQEQGQSGSKTQSAVSEEKRTEAKLELQDRLQIREEAKLLLQERLQDCSGDCFTDTGAHWAREQVGAAYAWGLINGYPDGSFAPDNDISGTEGTLMMSRLMDLVSGTIDDTSGSSGGIDWDRVPDWAAEQMQTASALRIMAQSQLYGSEKLNRLQFAVMLAKAAGIDPETPDEEEVAFLDQDSIPEEDLGYLCTLRTLGVIEGDSGYFAADRLVTRAEAAAMLTRVLDLLDTDAAAEASAMGHLVNCQTKCNN
jgi:hypothetical protein